MQKVYSPQKRLQTQHPKRKSADFLHTFQGQASKISSWNRSCFEPAWIVALNIPPRSSDQWGWRLERYVPRGVLDYAMLPIWDFIGEHALVTNHGYPSYLAELLGRHVLESWKQVQHECIPQAILGTDVLCQAKPGQLSEARRWDVTVKLTIYSLGI